MKRQAILFFLIASISEIFSQLFEINRLHLVVKPLIVVFLLLHYVLNTKAVNKVFVAALIFCWLGDVLLMFDDLFILGLSSFLLAHLFFIVSYRQLSNANDENVGPTKARLSFPIIMAGSGLVVILFPKLGDLKIPVMIYASVLTWMVLQSIFRLGRTSSKSFWMVFFGAVLFLLSDSLLAINKFYQPFTLAGAWVMITYIAAVFLIVQGAIKHELVTY